MPASHNRILRPSRCHAVYYSTSWEIYSLATNNTFGTFWHHRAANFPYFHTSSLKLTQQLISTSAIGQTWTTCDNLELMKDNFPKMKCVAPLYVSSGAKYILVKTFLLLIFWYSSLVLCNVLTIKYKSGSRKLSF